MDFTFSPRASLSNFCRVPDSYHRQAGRSSREAGRKSSRKRGVFVGIPGLGFGKRGLLEKGSLQKNPFSRVLENLEILEFLQNPPKFRPFSRDSLENLEILEISPAKRPLS